MSQFIVSQDPAQDLKSWLENRGYSHFGFAKLEKPLSLSMYKEWLNEGYHGEMAYLERHLADKENPNRLLPRAESAIVIAYHYAPRHPRPIDLPKVSSLKIASYAAGEDYHHWVKEDLEQIICSLKTSFPGHEFMAATDSSPVLERDLAYRAGLGWFGKNTCLIDQKKGSFFLIGEILTSLPLIPFTPLHADRCGTCQRCVEACPTQALVAPKVLDARKCISYLTIESKTAPTTDYADKIGNHFFGCDICQSVCPWNEKLFGPHKEVSPPLEEDLKFILSSSNSALERYFKYSPLSRARGFGLKRNAIVVAANNQLTALLPDILPYQTDPRFKTLVDWALAKLQPVSL